MKHRAKDLGRALGIAVPVLLLLSGGATVWSLSKPLAPSLSPTGQQPKSPSSKARATEKKPPNRIDPNTILTQPGIAQPGISQPPQQQPHFKVIYAPQAVRVGETVSFTLQSVNIPAGFSRPLEIDFGDKTPRQQLAGGQMNASHWYSAPGAFSVAVYLTGLRSAAFQTKPISEPLTLQVGSWALSRLPGAVEIGEQVVLSIDNPSTDRSIEYQFHFGDDPPASGWVSESHATHRYHSAGTVKLFIEIRRAIDPPMNTLARTAELPVVVKPLPQNSLRLDVTPAPKVRAGETVTFTATLVSGFDKGDSHIRFKFSFGDGKSSDWQPDPVAAHTYSLVGLRSARVEAAWFSGRPGSPTTFAASEPQQIEVTVTAPAQPNGPAQDAGSNANRGGVIGPAQGNRPANGKSSTGSSSGFWRDLGRYSSIIIPAIIVIALAILFAGYQTMKGRFSVKPDYRAHRDIGIGQTSGGSLAIEYGIHLKPDVAEARYHLDAPEAGLIRYERRQRD
ncbi:MAG TPA: hypothetical protein VN937_25355 [Blastocatellia bacterium]|nr:hypothetical protein [Blastocatellia bacterium]